MLGGIFIHFIVFRGQCEDDSDWSARFEAPQDTESQSSHTLEIPKHCHTLSESSCCSNDTLFNLEELNFASCEVEKPAEQSPLSNKEIFVKSEPNQENVLNSSDNNLPNILNITFVKEPENSNLKVIPNDLDKYKSTVQFFSIPLILNDFLVNERKFSESNNVKSDLSDQHKTKSTESLQTQDNLTKNYGNEFLTGSPITILDDSKPPETSTPLRKVESCSPQLKLKSEENVSFNDNYVVNNYEPITIDYSQYVDMENAKNSLEYDDSRKDADYINIIDKNPSGDEDNMYSILADIRFNGPIDSQLMSTSFTESNTCDEKEWDSGSDSRSSSSGEFIWKVSRHFKFIPST